MNRQTVTREIRRKKSNNKKNPNKNICALAVAKHLRVNKEGRYFHTITDLVYNARKKYVVRSRNSTHGKGLSVGKVRSLIKKHQEKEDANSVVGYLIRVPQHAIFLSADGQTIVDTAPRKRDRRKVTHIYIVYGGE